MSNGQPKFYLVRADALPETFVKVTQAKALLETGEARTIAEAVDKVCLSRSAFYKYRDAITPFRDMRRDTIVTLHITMHDRPGTLARVLRVFTDADANILTINQSIPANGVALVTVSIVTEEMSMSSDELMTRLGQVPGVLTAELMAG